MRTPAPYSPTFCLSETRQDPCSTKHFEGAFTQGSGFMHVRGSMEEGIEDAPQDEDYVRLPANVTLEKPRHPRSKWGTYVPGITGRHPLLKEELVNLPYFVDLRVTANGQRLDMDRSAISDYVRTLDLRDAVLRRCFSWRVDSEAVLDAVYTRFVSRARPHICVQEIDYTCTSGDVTCHFESGIDARVRTNGHNHFTAVSGTAMGESASISVTTDTGDTVAIQAEIRAAGMDFSSNTENALRPSCAASRLLHTGETVHIVKISAVATSRDSGPQGSPSERAKRAVAQAFDSLPTLYEEHAAVWDAMWERSYVHIEGDDEAQRAINFALYHLLRAANPDDPRVAVCAKGSAGEAYFGHFFWDTEIYLLPFFLYTRPEAARALIEFRFNTLEGARRNAALYGYEGARFPWESSVTGDEQCPNWQYADHEVHVTADVAHGIRHYWSATQDLDFLICSLETLVETSRYWRARVECKPDGSVNLNGVMGPDEYTCFSNNNAYTNSMVSRALRFTCEALRIVAEYRPEVHAAFVKRLGVTEPEMTELSRIADALPVRTRPNGVILQCDHFEDLEDVDFTTEWPDRSRPFGHFISQERTYRSKALKQADALMLAYLFPAEFSDETLAANYRYYEPLTTHDSSLSSVVHCILSTRLGLTEESGPFFAHARETDMNEGLGGAAEGIHIANCGGIWQAVVVGYAGMRWAYDSPHPEFHPRLPRQWKSLAFALLYRGKRYTVRIVGDRVDMHEVTE